MHTLIRSRAHRDCILDIHANTHTHSVRTANARHRRRSNDLLAHRSHGSARLLNSFINISTNNYRPSFTHTHTHMRRRSYAVARVAYLFGVDVLAHTQLDDKRINRSFVYSVVCACVFVYLPSHLACAVCTLCGLARVRLVILFVIEIRNETRRHTDRHAHTSHNGTVIAVVISFSYSYKTIYPPCLCNENDTS